jgi:anti-sigma B factor antagonist
VRGSRHTLTLAGELDLAAAADLNRKLLVLCREGTSAVVLDLRRLTFIDAAGLHIIVVAKELCQRYGSELALIPGPKQVQRVFELTNLLGVLPFQREHDGASRRTAAGAAAVRRGAAPPRASAS